MDVGDQDVFQHATQTTVRRYHRRQSITQIYASCAINAAREPASHIEDIWSAKNQTGVIIGAGAVTGSRQHDWTISVLR
jgi:hypothetical protein